jgi:hypothetical protein
MFAKGYISGRNSDACINAVEVMDEEIDMALLYIRNWIWRSTMEPNAGKVSVVDLVDFLE